MCREVELSVWSCTPAAPRSRRVCISWHVEDGKVFPPVITGLQTVDEDVPELRFAPRDEHVHNMPLGQPQEPCVAGKADTCTWDTGEAVSPARGAVTWGRAGERDRSGGQAWEGERAEAGWPRLS